MANVSQTSNATVLDLFKTVYGNLQELIPEDFPLAKDIPFSQKEKVGEKYVEAVCLTNETGWTLSSSTDAFELNPARAGTVKQAEVTPYITVLPSIVPWGVMSRSAGGGARAFADATRYVVRNNVKSHGRLQEILRLYARADSLLGYTSYFTGTYRNAAFTTGTGTINGVTFTNGINAASKYILFAPGSWASGIWTAQEGCAVNQVDANGVILATGSLTSINSEYGYIGVSFTPVAASTVTSTRICFDGMQNDQDMYGIQKILSTQSGSLFGINTSSYSLWQGNVINLNNTRLTLAKVQSAIANAVNKGGLESDIVIYCNPRSWATIASTEAGLRIYDESYKPSSAENGFEAIKFHSQNGSVTFKPHRCVKEGDAFGLVLSSWIRSGSAEISFTIPGAPGELIFPMPNQAGYCFRTFSDQFVFCHAPAHNLYFQNVNDEAAA